jgi:murein L,D-transpeptidase YcbB/YkuD
VLQADMTYVVFRPYWMVPSSIANRELWPKISNDPGYLDRNNMLVSNGRIRQRPGGKNSLGLLKFIFPNPHHVYLHDTPSKALFGRSRRDFSHGCVRVADPPALAEFVLAGMDGWDRERIDKAMKRGPDDRHVTLSTPIPVYLFYTTVVVDEAGAVHFFDDIYGHDATLQRQLAKGFPYSS